MPKNHFRDDFQGDTVSASICCRVPSQIVGRDINAEFLSVLLDQGSCCRIADGEESILGSERFSVDVFIQPFGDLLWHESYLFLLT